MEVNPALLRKYWSGECTPEEQKCVEKWMQEGAPDHTYPILGSADEGQLKDKLWTTIRPSFFRTVMSSRYTRMAAVVVFLISIAALTANYLQTSQADDGLNSYSTLEVAAGRRAELTLSDGSKVVLHSGSTLRYPKSFKGNERKIFMEGEAFFEISKNPKQPFIVETNNLRVRVLGTKFNVKDLNGREPTVTVVEGRVRLTACSDRDSLELTANESGTWKHDVLSKQTVDALKLLEWKEGKFSLQDIALREAIVELERWYGVKVYVADPKLLERHIKGTFNGESLSETLRLIALAMDTTVEIKNKEVTFGKK